MLKVTKGKVRQRNCSHQSQDHDLWGARGPCVYKGVPGRLLRAGNVLFLDLGIGYICIHFITICQSAHLCFVGFSRVIYFTIKTYKEKQLPGMAPFWASPVCRTCQLHFTPWLPAWSIPCSPPNCKLQIYRPSEPRWFPVIAARGIIMSTRLPTRSWMRFGRIFTAGSKTFLQSPSLSEGLGRIAVEPTASCSRQLIIRIPYSILESWLSLPCPTRPFDVLLLIIIAFQKPSSSCPHSWNFLFTLIGKNILLGRGHLHWVNLWWWLHQLVG